MISTIKTQEPAMGIKSKTLKRWKAKKINKKHLVELKCRPTSVSQHIYGHICVYVCVHRHKWMTKL